MLHMSFPAIGTLHFDDISILYEPILFAFAPQDFLH